MGALAISGNYALATGLRSGLQVIDIRNPSQPVLVGRFDPLSAENIVVGANQSYLATETEIQIFDTSTMETPLFIRKLTALGRPSSLAVVGHYAYATAGPFGFSILDLSGVPSKLIVTPPDSTDEIRISVQGEPGTNIRIDRSSDLETWQPWQTLSMGIEPISVTDTTTSPAGQGYYRAIAP